MILLMVHQRLGVLVMSSKYLLDVTGNRKTDMHFDDVEGTFIFNFSSL